MQPTDILSQFPRFDTKDKISEFLAQMKLWSNPFNEYLLAKVLERTSPDLIEHVKIMRQKYLESFGSYFERRKAIDKVEEKEPKSYFEGLSDMEIHAIKQRKFEKRMIIYTPQGGKNKRY